MVSRPGIVVVGDALLDRDVEGTAERLSPDAPVPVLDERRTVTRPGGAGLAACLAAESGDPVTLVTGLGDDAPSNEIRDLLSEVGVRVIAVRSSGPTPEKIRLLAGHRPLLRVDRGGPPGRVRPLTAAALRAVEAARVVVVSDYGRGLTSDASLQSRLRVRSGLTLWDPHPSGSTPVPGMTLVTPNQAELSEAFPASDDGMRSTVERTMAARRTWQAHAVVTTLGAGGAILVSGDGPPLAVPAVPATVGDPCGAGDRFVTAVAVRLLHGALLAEAVTDAVGVAGRFVADGGARAHLLASSRARDAHPLLTGTGGEASRGGRLTVVGGVASASHAAPPPGEQLAGRIRSAGGTVVVAGGCFDLLHAGHVSFLEAARRLGDCLIVALNSDASVRRLKGSGRPVVPEADRIALLLALACVDAVAVFEEDSPCNLLRRLRPEIFAKGGDYSSRKLPEQAVLKAWGGQAVLLPYLSGRSTTGLLHLVGSLKSTGPLDSPRLPDPAGSKRATGDGSYG